MELTRENQAVQSSSHLDCMNDARLDNFDKFLSLSSDTFGGYDMISLLFAEERLTNISYTPDDLYFQVASVGGWFGVRDVAEYIMLSRKEFNGGRYYLKMREVTGTSCLSQDSVEFETLDTFVISDRDDEITSTLKARVEFGPGTDLLSSIITDAQKELTEFSMGTIFDPRELCDTAVLRCPGDLYPYDSLQECYNFMSTLPQACSQHESSEGNMDRLLMNGYFQGDTVACRYIHLNSAALRPTYHCAHLSKGSSGKCSSKKCPSATRSATIQSLMPEFNASIPAWLLWIEIVLIPLMMIMFLFIHLWYRKQRRLFSGGVTANTKKAIGHDHKTFPEIKMKNVSFSWTKQFGGETVFNADNLSLGGSQVTALTGPSGTGKSSFMKLLAGFHLDHMKLNVGQFVNRTKVLLCDQSSAMWPKEMLVQDIFFFSYYLFGSNLDQVSYILETLKINEFLGQKFGTLSGGQAQLVHIASAIVSPSPTLIFLDEPFSSLDDRKAIILMDVLKEISKKCGHSFVTTVHTCSDALEAKFDNFVTLEGGDGSSIVQLDQYDGSIIGCSDRRSGSSYFDRAATSNINNNEEDTYDLGMKQHNEGMWRNDRVAEMKALMILWHAQFFGLPIIEIIVTIVGITGGLLVGYMSHGAVVEHSDVDYIPTSEVMKSMFSIVASLLGPALVLSFGVAHVYWTREAELVRNFNCQGTLRASSYIIATLVRSMVSSIIMSLCWLLTVVSIVEGTGSNTAMIIANFSVFLTMWTCLSSFICGIAPVAYSAHVLLYLCSTTLLLSGSFFSWKYLYSIFKIFHYGNPLFLFGAACSYLFLEDLDPGCLNHDGLLHYSQCTSGERVYELSGLPQVNSLLAQGAALIFLFLSLFGVAKFVLKGPKVL